MLSTKPLVLIILDGWGYAPPAAANAISLARKPNYDKLLAEFPNTLIHTSGRYVGLPDRADGQQRSRSPEHRRRARRLHGHHQDRSH